ncbi:unnamed protein product, partial [Brassica oleracea var. botrytis]
HYFSATPFFTTSYKLYPRYQQQCTQAITLFWLRISALLIRPF